MSVAGQELLDAQRGLTKARPDEHGVAEPVGDQLDPAKDEGPHEDVGELAVGLDEGEEIVPLHVDHLSRLADPKADERLPPREHVGLAGELARPLNRDDLLGIRFPPYGLDGTRGDDEERLGLPSRRLQDLSLPNRADAPMGGDARDLRRRQRGKHLLGARGRRQREAGPCARLAFRMRIQPFSHDQLSP